MTEDTNSYLFKRSRDRQKNMFRVIYMKGVNHSALRVMCRIAHRYVEGPLLRLAAKPGGFGRSRSGGWRRPRRSSRRRRTGTRRRRGTSRGPRWRLCWPASPPRRRFFRRWLQTLQTMTALWNDTKIRKIKMCSKNADNSALVVQFAIDIDENEFGKILKSRPSDCPRW